MGGGDFRHRQRIAKTILQHLVLLPQARLAQA